MTSFSYQNNLLGADTAKGWLSLSETLQSETSAVYIYNASSIKNRAQALTKALTGITHKSHYAMKANANKDILKLVKDQGFGIDAVSSGEILWALENGFKASDIIFSGVAKSKEELTLAIDQQIKQINVESLPELVRIGELCKTLNKSASLGLRLNPDIKVDTHPYITTGFRENKFGLPEDQIRDAVKIVKKYQPWLKLSGLSCHLGSQMRDLSPIEDSLKALLAVSEQLMSDGFKLSTIDIGGGVGIDYHTGDETHEIEMIQQFGQMMSRYKTQLPGELLLEPGRWIVARAGVLCARVEYIKFNGYKNFLIVNTGMNHLMRPSLYKAFHRTLPVVQNPGETKLYDVVGPICESSDVLGHDRMFPPMNEGDWVAILDAGAYGMSMANFYNRHELPKEILV